MQKIVFIGGVKGVGKSTMIETLKKLDRQFSVFDPAEMFDLYFLREKVVKAEVLEKMVTEGLAGLSACKTLINWHYGVWNDGRYIPHVEWYLLKKLSESLPGSTEIYLILLTESVEEVYNRRKNDNASGKKRRKNNRSTIEKEIEIERQYFLRIQSCFRQENIVTVIVKNGNLGVTSRKLLPIINS